MSARDFCRICGRQIRGEGREVRPAGCGTALVCYRCAYRTSAAQRVRLALYRYEMHGDEGIPGTRRCAGQGLGGPCRGPALVGSDFCRWHQEQAQDAGR